MKKVTSISRAEMKKIMGGTDAPGARCSNECMTDADCAQGYACYWITFPSEEFCTRCIIPELNQQGHAV